MKLISDLKPKDVSFLARSFDYKDRFIGEYFETLIRYESLHKMIVKAEAGTLNFTPSCPIDLLHEQKRHMGEYLHSLEVRAQIEDIDLDASYMTLLADIEAEADCETVPDHPTY